MHFIKALAFLFLVLLANPAIAFPSPEKYLDNIETGISAEFTGDVQELSQTILTVPAGFSPELISLWPPFNFYFHSTYKAVLANKYIAFSRSIDPSLGISDIIFPFHFFL